MIETVVTGLNVSEFNGPVLLPFYNGSSGIRPGEIAYDQIGVIVPGTPGMVYWDGVQWVQFLGTSTVPTLQEVTDEGATTTNSITISDSADTISRELLVSVNSAASAVHIQAGRESGEDIASILMEGTVVQFSLTAGINLEIINGSSQVLMTILADGSGTVDRNGVVRQSGTGSPESVITGAVGSTWSRTDGAPGETFYIKQSGTGNTGWAPVA